MVFSALCLCHLLPAAAVVPAGVYPLVAAGVFPFVAAVASEADPFVAVVSADLSLGLVVVFPFLPTERPRIREGKKTKIKPTGHSRLLMQPDRLCFASCPGTAKSQTNLISVLQEF